MAQAQEGKDQKPAGARVEAVAKEEGAVFRQVPAGTAFALAAGQENPTKRESLASI
jgi:hypothetical protein